MQASTESIPRLPADIARCDGFRQRSEFAEPEVCPIRDTCLRFLSKVPPGLRMVRLWPLASDCLEHCEHRIRTDGHL